MIKLLTLIFLLCSVSAFAKTASNEDLMTLRLFIENAHRSTLSLTDDSSHLAEKQSQLSRLSLIKRGKISKENCQNVKVTVSTNLMMVTNALEVSKKALEKLSLTTDQEQEVTTGFQDFIRSSTEAMETCRDIPMTVVVLQETSNSLESILKVFKTIPAFDI